jgi:hypothetical protein
VTLAPLKINRPRFNGEMVSRPRAWWAGRARWCASSTSTAGADDPKKRRKLLRRKVDLGELFEVLHLVIGRLNDDGARGVVAGPPGPPGDLVEFAGVEQPGSKSTHRTTAPARAAAITHGRTLARRSPHRGRR